MGRLVMTALIIGAAIYVALTIPFSPRGAVRTVSRTE